MQLGGELQRACKDARRTIRSSPGENTHFSPTGLNPNMSPDSFISSTRTFKREHLINIAKKDNWTRRSLGTLCARVYVRVSVRDSD